MCTWRVHVTLRRARDVETCTWRSDSCVVPHQLTRPGIHGLSVTIRSRHVPVIKGESTVSICAVWVFLRAVPREERWIPQVENLSCIRRNQKIWRCASHNFLSRLGMAGGSWCTLRLAGIDQSCQTLNRSMKACWYVWIKTRCEVSWHSVTKNHRQRAYLGKKRAEHLFS